MDVRETVAFTASREGDEPAVLVVLAGRVPGVSDAEFGALADEIEEGAGRMTFSPDEQQHRRGDFMAKAHGFSHGGGQKVRRLAFTSATLTDR